MTERYSEYIKNSNQRRKAIATAKTHLESLYTHVSIDEATDPTERQLLEFVEQIAECSGQVADCGDGAEFDDLSEQDLDTTMETECTAEAYPLTVGDEGNGDKSEDEQIEQPTITTSLMNWALEYSITLVALTALLSILKNHHPSLPKDAKTLLHTSRNYIIKQVAGGAYFYFGIVNSLSRFLSDAWCKIPDRHTIKLQLNFDGLPLYKSSCVQLWPVLGLVQGFSMKQKPCLIALFGGRSKPHLLGDYLRDLVTEIKHLTAGFAFKGKTLFIKITSVMCDAPA